MRKNILVLTGSPRRKGNSDALADAFIKGALSNGHDVARFDTARYKIAGCTSCKTCWSKGKPCSLDDDFEKLAPLLEAADTIVFATPLYWFGFPAQLKAAIDRLYPYIKEVGKDRLKIKESLLLVCAADDYSSLFDGIIATYKEIAQYMDWANKGVLTITGVLDKGDIEETDALIKAEEYGKTLV